MCPLVSEERRASLVFRCMPRADIDTLVAGHIFEKPLAADLTPYQHVSFGNVRVQSRYFSCSRKIDPAFYWSTCVVRDGVTRHSRGHNWRDVGIAVLDLRLCDVRADVSNSHAACAHGLSSVYQVDDNGSVVTDQRAHRLATSNHEVILSRIYPNAVIQFRTVEEILRLGPPQTDAEAMRGLDDEDLLRRWTEYAAWAARGSKPITPPNCPLWLMR